MSFRTPKRAELALTAANVRVIYVAVDYEGRLVAENFFAYGVGVLGKFKQVAAREKFQRRVLSQSQIDSPRTKIFVEEAKFPAAR